ncbi:DMT family transporter [Nocardia sp. NPDC056000]|uniref:EamA family transporter n=1 Tax=Nocardia sp. NPDC056000 TaxID=3345674 RepID=UPI0035D9C613
MIAVAAGFGIVTLSMNIVFFEAIARIPLGTAVAIEFLGPVAVATLGSRRARDLLAVALVAIGVILLAGVQLDVEPVGIAFALAAAVLWAGYILVGKRVADAGDGQDSLAVGMAAAAILSAPFVLIPQFAIDATVFADPRTWLLGLGIGILSSAVPYALDQVVLTAVGRARFALLLALLPATASVVGAIALAQRPTVFELAGMALVMLALAISAIPTRQPTPEPPAPL